MRKASSKCVQGEDGDGLTTHSVRSVSDCEPGEAACVRSMRSRRRHLEDSIPQSPELASLIAEGVETRTATALADTHTPETILHYLRAYRVKKASGKAVGVGWLISAVTQKWQVKVPDRTPEQIAQRNENARTASERYVVKELAAPMEMPEWEKHYEATRNLKGLVAQNIARNRQEGVGIGA
jgi:hypothetical protein